ncbi:alpha/beta hydrolase [Nocardia tengchongensis]|uniref:alpha/beta hydrolase n=1 Tax=Nocardia tengchongensis TaxID=2055889 RepID=UPI0036B06EAC
MTLVTAPVLAAISRRSYLRAGAAALVLGALSKGTAAASPVTPKTSAGELETVMVPSTMGPVPVQIQWAHSGGGAALYLLDGLRASDAANGWAMKTTATQLFRHDDITLVMPVGGHGSWYADWSEPPAAGDGPWLWETFLTQDLPRFLAGRGISPRRNALAGVSMGASAALRIASRHSGQFVYVAALSGFLDWHSPGGVEAVRAITHAAGLDPNHLAPEGSAEWQRMDPYTFAPELRGMPMYISAASGVPDGCDVDCVTATLGGVAIEVLASESTHAFQARLESLSIPAIFRYPALGTHSWRSWSAALEDARPGLVAALIGS